MSEKSLLTVIAVSTSIVAAFCLWFVGNQYYSERKIGEILRQSEAAFPSSFAPVPVTSDADLARERAEIERQLNRKK